MQWGDFRTEISCTLTLTCNKKIYLHEVSINKDVDAPSKDHNYLPSGKLGGQKAPSKMS